MAQQVKVLVTKHNNLSSIPRTHVVEGEKVHKLAPDFHACTCMYAHTHTHSAHTETHPKCLFPFWKIATVLKNGDCLGPGKRLRECQTLLSPSSLVSQGPMGIHSAPQSACACLADMPVCLHLTTIAVLTAQLLKPQPSPAAYDN